VSAVYALEEDTISTANAVLDKFIQDTIESIICEDIQVLEQAI